MPSNSLIRKDPIRHRPQTVGWKEYNKVGERNYHILFAIPDVTLASVRYGNPDWNETKKTHLPTHAS